MSETSKRVLDSYSGTSVSYETERVVDLALTLAREVEAAEKRIAELEGVLRSIRARVDWAPGKDSDAAALHEDVGALSRAALSKGR